MAPHASVHTTAGHLQLTDTGLSEGSVALAGHVAALASRAGAHADIAQG